MGGRGYSLDRVRDSRWSRARLALLGIWVGALAAFGGLFVPAAFAHLPTQLAATVLGEGFNALDRGGAALGASCAVLGLIDVRRSAARADRLRALLPLAGVFAHLTSALAIAPRIHALRVAAGGAIGQLAAGDPELAEFARLHSLSRALFALAAASALLACVWDLFAQREDSALRASRDTKSSDF
jgi:hypothetical protein